MRRIIAFVLLVAFASAAQGQAMSKKEMDAYDAELAKMQKCRFAPSSLIGLTTAQLRSKCGRWSRSNTTTTADGQSEQLIFGGSLSLLYVYTVNDVVTSVQSR